VRGGFATEAAAATQAEWLDATMAVNAAYAALHGYGYAFGHVVGSARRSAQWQKVPFLRALAQQCPSSRLLFLDSDAYVRAFTERILAHGAGLAGAFDSSWLKENGDRCLTMEEHNRAFQEMDASPSIEGGVPGRTSVNTGALFFPNPAKTVDMLAGWWEQTLSWTQYDDTWPREQQALSVLLLRNSTLRRDVLLLDPLFYGGPRGTYVRHHYGKSHGQQRPTAEMGLVLTLVCERMRELGLSANATAATFHVVEFASV
jgi:hypothetical protein